MACSTGSTNTLRTEDNVNTFMDRIENLVTSEKWFDNGMYQGGTTRELEAIHVSDTDVTRRLI